MRLCNRSTYGGSLLDGDRHVIGAEGDGASGSSLAGDVLMRLLPLRG
jgi:hypothetical protein